MAENDKEQEPLEQETPEQEAPPEEAGAQDAGAQDAGAQDAGAQAAGAQAAAADAAVAASVTATQADTGQPAEKQKHTTTVLAVLLVVAAACLCVVMASSAGLGFFGRNPAPTPEAPVPTATPIPTPEPGNPPVAVIGAPNEVTVGVEFTLDGSNSAGSSPVVEYLWDFGDGTGGKGAVVTHTYIREGDYVVALQVTDQNGLADSSNMRIRAYEAVEDQPPTAVINAPGEAQVGDPVTFNGNESTGQNPVVSYAWDFGDRTQGSGAVVEHVYGKAGTYKVTLTVTDNTGLTGSATVEINIVEGAQTPPVAVIAGPSQAGVGQDVTFDAGESQPGSGAIVNYAWDFGNGKTTDGKNSSVTTRYDAPGAYQVVLTVTDENGLTSSANTQISVQSTLEGTTWSLTNTLPEAPITATLKKGKLAGSSGCNDYSGAYAVDDPAAPSGAITFSNVAASRSVCDDNIMQQEAVYLQALQAVTNYNITGETLTLSYPGGTLIFQDAAGVELQ